MRIRLLILYLDQIDFNSFGIQHKFEEELRRFNKFQRTVLGLSDPKAKHEEFNIRTYAKYILKDGTTEEKRELMGCIKSTLKITKGTITVDL